MTRKSWKKPIKGKTNAELIEVVVEALGGEKPLFVGEFGVQVGDRAPGSKYYDFFGAVLQVAEKTASMVCAWVWELPNQEDTWSIYQHNPRDHDLIRQIREAS